MKQFISPGMFVNAAVLGLAACNTATTTFADARTVSTTVGQEVKIGRYSSWDNFCAPMLTNVITKTAPAHGMISTRIETYVSSGGLRMGTIDCSGKTMQGAAVYYLPQAGFRGSDHLELTVPFPTGTINYAIRIQVN